MDTSSLKKFAPSARARLIDQVGAKLDHVIAVDSQARRETPKAVTELEKQISRSSKEQLVERVAYIWFNRLMALRYMDVHGYNRVKVVSPAEDGSRPEILADAAAGHISDDLVKPDVKLEIWPC